MKKNFPNFLLAVFPILIILVGLLMLGRQTLHYTVSSDPEYFYLFSGLNIARFDFISGDFHHPGIPLQIYSGIVIGIDYLFGGRYPDIITDLILRPEHYIFAINGSLIIFTGFVFFLCGLAVYRLTGNLFAAIFLQILPFTNSTSFFQLTFIVPERIILPLFFFIIVLLVWYIQRDHSEKKEKKLIILLAILITLCFLQKLTMLPLVLLPFFIIKKKKNIMLYLASLGISTLVLMVPIITHLQEMWRFLSEMSTHSGLYGGGKKQFIDFATIIPNLKNIQSDHKVMFYSFFLILIFLPFTFVKRFATTPKSKKIRNVLVAVTVVELLMMVMLLKHFKSHYATPIIALSLFNYYLIIEFIGESNLIKSRKFSSYTYLVLTVFLLFSFYPSTVSSINIYNEKKEYENQIIKIGETYKNMPKIIFQRYYGTPFVDFSIFQGIYNSRHYELYGGRAKELFPDSYFYTAEWGVYDMTYKSHQLTEILRKHKNFILSFYQDDQATMNAFYKEIEKAGLDRIYSYKTLYYNDISKAVIVQMSKNDTLNQYETVYSFSWDMESTPENRSYPEFKVGMGNLIEYISLSGKSSQALSNLAEFGAKILFDSLQENDRVRATVWRFRNGNQSGIVIAADSTNKLYSLSTSVIEATDFWDKIELSARIPSGLEHQSIKLYLWQCDKSGPVYFDDFKAEVFREDINLVN